MVKISGKLEGLISDASQKLHRIKPGDKIKLGKLDPDDISIAGVDKKLEKDMGIDLQDQLVALQDLLYAEHKHKVLVILQAMDTAGKDGIIKHVFKGVNPQGVRVAAFKAPTPIELSHDYLWRIHQQTPARGEMVIFNRSHYEDVLVTRVHGMIDEKTCHRRYQHINNFEQMLADEGVTILKFFLHIDADEQKSRLQSRIDDPDKNWKFSSADIEERKLWPRYMEAYENAIAHTSTAYAPWYVIPSNRKWYRNLTVSLILVDQLKRLGMAYPKPVEKLDSAMIL
ncbi:MAG: polyphosphate kinase 2 family protein [Candidatus Omnitrophota bacterium]